MREDNQIPGWLVWWLGLGLGCSPYPSFTATLKSPRAKARTDKNNFPKVGPQSQG